MITGSRLHLLSLPANGTVGVLIFGCNTLYFKGEFRSASLDTSLRLGSRSDDRQLACALACCLLRLPATRVVENTRHSPLTYTDGVSPVFRHPLLAPRKTPAIGILLRLCFE